MIPNDTTVEANSDELVSVAEVKLDTLDNTMLSVTEADDTQLEVAKLLDTRAVVEAMELLIDDSTNNEITEDCTDVVGSTLEDSIVWLVNMLWLESKLLVAGTDEDSSIVLLKINELDSKADELETRTKTTRWSG